MIYIYNFITIALDESVILGVLHFSIKTLRNHVTVSHMGGATPLSICLFTHVGVTSVANLAFLPPFGAVVLLFYGITCS